MNSSYDIAVKFKRIVFAYLVGESLQLRELTPLQEISCSLIGSKLFALTVAQYEQKVSMAMSE